MKAVGQVRTQDARELEAHLPELQAALAQQRQFRLSQIRELDDVHDEVNEILRAGITRALVEVDAALERIRTGSYGVCEKCATPIAFERLEILPMSRYCMRCQHGHEARRVSGESRRRLWGRT